MALLRDIALGNITGIAPTPVEKYAIENHFVSDGLFNIMEFTPLGMGTGTGNLAASYVKYDDAVGADFRGLGEEYDADNANPEPKTVYLKALGGSYTVDRITDRALKNGGINVFREQQVAQKANSIKNGFAKYFISGDSSTNPKAFNGVYKGVVAEYPEQENKIAHALPGGLTNDNAIGLEQHFNDVISLMNVEPNAVITTRKGASLAKTLNAHRNMFTGVVEIGDVKYNQLMGLPIVTVEESYFPVGKTAIGVPFVFVYIADDTKGIRAGIPIDGQVVNITDPEDGSGTMIKEGAVEMITVPIFSNNKSVAIGYVDTTPYLGAGGVEG